MYSKIVSTGCYLPEKILSNSDLEQMVDTSDEWITVRTGIKQRHIVTDETVADMGYLAALSAIKTGEVDINDIELIIVATTSSSHAFPSSACIIQGKLGIKDCTAFDVAAACTGFIYALEIANQFLKSGKVKCALVIGSDALSTTVDKTDRSTVILFGDGAGAMIIQASSDKSSDVIDTYTRSLPEHSECLMLPYKSRYGNKNAFLTMQGNVLFRLAVNELSYVTTHMLERNHLSSHEINWLVPHQANIRIIQATAKKLKLPLEKIILTLENHGNTSAASIAIAFHYGVVEQKIKRGDLVLMESFGGGLTSGSALLKF